jgi:hypothetical protein
LFDSGSFPVKRRMAAIMVGDIVGYSAMMEKSEEKNRCQPRHLPTLISEKVASFDGRMRGFSRRRPKNQPNRKLCLERDYGGAVVAHGD